MTDLDLLIKGAVFVLELFAWVFGALFVVLRLDEIVQQWKAGRE